MPGARCGDYIAKTGLIIWLELNKLLFMTGPTESQSYLPTLQTETDEAEARQEGAQPILPQNYDEHILVDACLRGEEVAWQAFLERYGRLIYTIARRFGFSQLVAEEIYQDVCLTVFEKLSTLRDRQRLTGWLTTITRRVCIRRLRMRDLAGALDNALDLDSFDYMTTEIFEEKILLVEQNAVLRQAVADLDLRCQQLLQALFFDPLPDSYETIATQLAIPLGSLSPLRQRCLEKLRFKLLHIDPTLADRDERQFNQTA